MRLMHVNGQLIAEMRDLRAARPATELPLGLAVAQAGDGWAIAGFPTEQAAEQALRRLMGEPPPAEPPKQRRRA